LGLILSINFSLKIIISKGFLSLFSFLSFTWVNTFFLLIGLKLIQAFLSLRGVYFMLSCLLILIEELDIMDLSLIYMIFFLGSYLPEYRGLATVFD
jgi:hypothetical protein